MLKGFNVIEFISGLDRAERSYFYKDINHPAKCWDTEDKLLYLQALSLLLDIDNSSYQYQERWFFYLMSSMGIDGEQVWQSLQEFNKNPEDHIVISFLQRFRFTYKAELFLYDAFGLINLSENTDDDIVKNISKQLKVPNDIYEILKNSCKDKSLRLVGSKVHEILKKHIQSIFVLRSLGDFVNIPGGKLMNASENSYNKVFKHELDVESFVMQAAPVTFEMWDFFTSNNKDAYAPTPSDEGWGRNDRPVINISFNDIVNLFLPWLNSITDKEFRLPTELEWEYACRAQTENKFYWGDFVTQESLNFALSGNNKTVPIKLYTPNAWGLYDMLGNVWEWVQDEWGSQESIADEADSEKECYKYRVLKGGSFCNTFILNSACRNRSRQNSRMNNIGFRLVVEN